MTLVLLFLGVIGLATFAGFRSRGLSGSPDRVLALADARAAAQQRTALLAEQLADLDGGHDPAARQAISDASARLEEAGRQLESARSAVQAGFAERTASDGLNYVRAARMALEDKDQARPFYYGGGSVGGRAVAAGWYDRPWWRPSAEDRTHKDGFDGHLGSLNQFGG